MTEPRDEHDTQAEADIEAPPPILGSWNRLYLVVLLNLVLLIVLLYAFRKAFE